MKGFSQFLTEAPDPAMAATARALARVEPELQPYLPPDVHTLQWDEEDARTHELVDAKGVRLSPPIYKEIGTRAVTYQVDVSGSVPRRSLADALVDWAKNRQAFDRGAALRRLPPPPSKS